MKNLLDQIEAYLEGTLSPKEKLAFEAEMEADPKIRKKMEFVKGFDSHLEGYIHQKEQYENEQKTIKIAEENHNEIPDPDPIPIIPIWRKHLKKFVAAASFCLAVPSVHIYLNHNRPNPEVAQLVINKAYKSPSTMSGDPQSQLEKITNLEEGSAGLMEGNMEKAKQFLIDKFQDPPKTEIDYQATLYKAGYLVKTDQLQKAKEQLNYILQNKSYENTNLASKAISLNKRIDCKLNWTSCFTFF